MANSKSAVSNHVRVQVPSSALYLYKPRITEGLLFCVAYIILKGIENMKKLIPYALLLSIMLSLTACRDSETSPDISESMASSQTKEIVTEITTEKVTTKAATTTTTTTIETTTTTITTTTTTAELTTTTIETTTEPVTEAPTEAPTEPEPEPEPETKPVHEPEPEPDSEAGTVHFIINTESQCVHTKETCRAAQKILAENYDTIDICEDEIADYAYQYWACGICAKEYSDLLPKFE